MARATSLNEDSYAAWAPAYPPRAHNPLMEVEQAAVLELLPPVHGLRVLDAGCGTGRYMTLLASRGAKAVVGIDLSEAMLCRADASLTRVRAHLRQLPIADESFDVVVSGLALLDVPALAEVFCEWARVLRPGGLAICSTLHARGATLGWTRSFPTSRGTRTLPAFWHSLDDHRRACALAGLSIEAFTEPCLRVREGRHAPVTQPMPVALVVRARKPSPAFEG